jgi:hypothetical protein
MGRSCQCVVEDFGFFNAAGGPEADAAAVKIS